MRKMRNQANAFARAKETGTVNPEKRIYPVMTIPQPMTSDPGEKSSLQSECWWIAPEINDAQRRQIDAWMAACRGRCVQEHQAMEHHFLRYAVAHIVPIAQCRQWAEQIAVDCAYVSAVSVPDAIVLDMDSTLITMEVIDELAKEAGAGDAVAAITEAAMRGELDFNESLIARVATLKGLPLTVIEQVKRRLRFNEGVEAFAAFARARDCYLAVISGGFIPFAEQVKQTLHFQYAQANQLEMNELGLTGRVLGDIVNAQTKASSLQHIKMTHANRSGSVWAVGDGANDALMLEAATLGVAFRAKPALKAKASLALDVSDMRALATIIDALS